MIKGIYQSGRYMVVSGGGPTPNPSIYNTYGGNTMGPQSFTGQMRYNVSSQSMEVFDGNNWQVMQTSVANVGLSQEAEHILDWARKKMYEEQDLKVRMEKHPGLKQAYEQFQIMDALTAEEEKIGKESAGVQRGP